MDWGKKVTIEKTARTERVDLKQKIYSFSAVKNNRRGQEAGSVPQ